MSDKKFNILGESGKVLSSKNLGENLKRSDFENNKDLLKIFDFYNTNKSSKGEEVLDKKELDKMLSDLLTAAKEDKVLEPTEIKKYLNDIKLDKSVGTDDVVGFLTKIITDSESQKIYKDIKGAGTSSSLKAHLNEINPENITEILNTYEKNNKETLVQAISNESGSWGSTRNKYLKTIRDKLVERATQLGVSSEQFITSFDRELGKMDMSWCSGEDSSALDLVVKNFMDSIAKPEKIYNNNKNGILLIMSDSDLCRTDDDKKAILDKIMEYSQKNNPKEMLENISATSKTPIIKNAAQKLIKSGYMDYFPIFVASIVAQESQFREFDDAVFSPNGQGVMQVTKTIIDDMYTHPGMYDDNFIERIQSQYSDSTDLYEAVQDREDSSLNFDVGTAGLKAKLNTVLRKMKNGEYKNMGIKTDSPEAIMELIAMNYNGNKDTKRDAKFGNTASQVRYVYARDVLMRFKKYTPEGVSVKHYFEYNPKSKTFVNH